MKTIKVSIQDEHTLVLQEIGQKGDLIDLKSIHEVDIDKSTIENVINSIKRDEFNAQLEKETKTIETKMELQAKLKEKEIIDRAKDALSKKDQEILTLNSKIEVIAKQTESDTKLKDLEEKQKIMDDYRQKLSEKDTEISEIKHKGELEVEKLNEKLRSSETALVSLKEMRSKMSTKMIGESLETHCENEFNKIRPFAFPNAKFGKDNTVSGTGSKGDYIYRESDEDGNEILSIMFEMKNEEDGTATKHKNKDFFKELDKDRKEKDCEFAVLVSLLEKDNEYYDDIVTVHEYSNMYSIRPQHFITTIGFLRQGNIKSQELRRQIQILKNQNIDVTNFENNMNAFKDAFARNYNLASDQFANAIKEIDNTIDHLNKVKENLLKSDNNLRLANNKAIDLSIKKLTANSPSVAKAFEK
ncbi:MAG TPA: DUF2130 domain-containing protein [Patescibacteria group bacterium]|jgi:hypothetical protein|nr:DUF2130 domain-containing protein [Patescibacteria group bacterium]